MLSDRADPRWGVTLVELLVVLVILGITAGVSGAAVAALRALPERDLASTLRRTRTMSIHQGTARMVWIKVEGSERPPTLFRFLPDGRVLGPDVDPWTGTLLSAKGDSVP